MQVRALTNIDEIIPFVSQEGKVTVRIIDQATGKEFGTAQLSPTVEGEVVNFTGSIACPWPESETRSAPTPIPVPPRLNLGRRLDPA